MTSTGLKNIYRLTSTVPLIYVYFLKHVNMREVGGWGFEQMVGHEFNSNIYHHVFEKYLHELVHDNKKLNFTNN